MICIGVCEQNPKRIEDLRKRILQYSMRTDRDFKMLWMIDGEADKKIVKYAQELQIVLISLDLPEGRCIGKSVYRENPNCLICYYKSEKCDLEPVLGSRPIAFYLWEDKNDQFEVKLNDLIEEMMSGGRVFVYETRKTKHVIPIQNIAYFQSNLKYVEVHGNEKDECSLYAKLTDIEKLLEEQGVAESFLRIHKSYIVNVSQIVFVDKTSHMVELLNGDVLPISNVHYSKVVKNAF